MNTKMNFSNSEIWNNSIFIRYPIDKIRKIGNVYFYEEDNILICQNFFEPNIKNNELYKLKDYILESKKIRFNYINDSNTLKRIKKMATDNSFNYEIIDSWEAPRLVLKKNISSYFENNCGSQIKRNYKRYLKNQNNYKYYNSKYDDVLKLWNYVLRIDFNSWKKEENSDMKSLNREDLQYLPFLLLEKENSSLIVICDLDDNPLAYSLMFKGDNNYWYAVKWGASYLGRKKYAGFFCLFNHLEHLYSKKKQLNIDFWGRRNKTYDSLKNKSVIRNHILICKKEE